MAYLLSVKGWNINSIYSCNFTGERTISPPHSIRRISTHACPITLEVSSGQETSMQPSHLAGLAHHCRSRTRKYEVHHSHRVCPNNEQYRRNYTQALTLSFLVMLQVEATLPTSNMTAVGHEPSCRRTGTILTSDDAIRRPQCTIDKLRP